MSIETFTDEVMRRSGETTRLVDEAIQHLFKVGVAVVPNSIPRLNRGFLLGNSSNVFIDPDSESDNEAQLELARRIYARLNLEHTDQFIMSDANGYTTFIIK